MVVGDFYCFYFEWYCFWRGKVGESFIGSLGFFFSVDGFYDYKYRILCYVLSFEIEKEKIKYVLRVLLCN